MSYETAYEKPSQRTSAASTPGDGSACRTAPKPDRGRQKRRCSSCSAV